MHPLTNMQLQRLEIEQKEVTVGTNEMHNLREKLQFLDDSNE